MSKQIIEAINTSSTFQFEGDTAELRLYPTQAFLASTGQMVGQGSPWNIESWYLPITCDVQPTGVLYVPSFEIDSTTDGQPRTSKYIAALFDEGESYIGPFPLMNPNGFAVPPTSLMPSPTWGQLQIYNRLPTLLYPPQTFPTRDEMYAAIAEAISQEWVKASATVVGATALDVDPTDPTFPIAVGINSPLLGEAVVHASGVATIALGDGSVTVSTDKALTGSVILLTAGEGVQPAVSYANIVDGVSFDIIGQFGDDGPVSWVIL